MLCNLFCPSIKHNILKFGVCPMVRNLWLIWDPVACQELFFFFFFQKMCNCLLQMACSGSKNSCGQCYDCSIRSYHIWPLFPTLVALITQRPSYSPRCLYLLWGTSGSLLHRMPAACPVTHRVVWGKLLSGNHAVSRTWRSLSSSVLSGVCPFILYCGRFKTQ